MRLEPPASKLQELSNTVDDYGMKGFFENIAGILSYIYHEAIVLSSEVKAPNMTPDRSFSVESIPGSEQAETSYENLKALRHGGLDTWIN